MPGQPTRRIVVRMSLATDGKDTTDSWEVEVEVDAQATDDEIRAMAEGMKEEVAGWFQRRLHEPRIPNQR